MAHFCVYPFQPKTPKPPHPLSLRFECPAGKDISISAADNPLGPRESNEDRCDANDREVAEISRSTDDNRLAKDKKKDLDLEQEQEPLSEEQSFKKQKVSSVGLGSPQSWRNKIPGRAVNVIRLS